MSSLTPSDESTRSITDSQWNALLIGKKIAIVHDWLTSPGGAEVVLQHLLLLFPDAEVFTLIDKLPAKHRGFLAGKTVKTSFLNKFPLIHKYYKIFFPFMPVIIENFNFIGYDIIFSSSYSVAKGVLTSPEQIHISYCHSPMRYAWDMQHQYLGTGSLLKKILSAPKMAILHYMRIWDFRSSASVDHFIANSNFIKMRILKYYRRESVVIHPPVPLSMLPCVSEKERYYITISRQVAYKKIDIIVNAFKLMPARRIVIIGDGPEHKRLKRLARNHQNITFTGYLNRSEMITYLSKAQAFVFAAEEDFGIAPLESQACGTPVIALGKGGAKETVIDGVTGILFQHQNAENVIAAVKRFESVKESIIPSECRKHAERFSADVFLLKMKNFVFTTISYQMKSST